MKFISWIFVLSILSISGCGKWPRPTSTEKEHWNYRNDPITLLPSTYLFKLEELPLAGEISSKPWADTYWPSSQGGIASRWAVGIAGHEVTPVPLSEASSLTLSQMADLSPAEKFDIFAGDESLSLFNNEIERTHPTDGSWFGICHGWAPASLAWAEPKAVILTSAGGIKVPFASSDIKALLSLFTAEYAPEWTTKSLGSRCNEDLNTTPDSANWPECRDVNAGAFHLVLANLLGINHEGFVADVTRDAEVWNQPVSGFTSREIRSFDGKSPGAAPTTVREVSFETTMVYGREISPSWKSSGPNMAEKVYSYRLELDISGSIVGGEWLNELRPDFLWSMGKPEFLDAASIGRRRAIAWTKAMEIYTASMNAVEEARKPVE